MSLVDAAVSRRIRLVMDSSAIGAGGGTFGGVDALIQLRRRLSWSTVMDGEVERAAVDGSSLVLVEEVDVAVLCGDESSW